MYSWHRQLHQIEELSVPTLIDYINYREIKGGVTIEMHRDEHAFHEYYHI